MRHATETQSHGVLLKLFAVRDRVAKLIQKGKTQEQAVAARPTPDFDAKVGNAAASADSYVRRSVRN